MPRPGTVKPNRQAAVDHEASASTACPSRRMTAPAGYDVSSARAASRARAAGRQSGTEPAVSEGTLEHGRRQHGVDLRWVPRCGAGAMHSPAVRPQTCGHSVLSSVPSVTLE